MSVFTKVMEFFERFSNYHHLAKDSAPRNDCVTVFIWTRDPASLLKWHRYQFAFGTCPVRISAEVPTTLRVFVVFLSPSRRMPRKYITLWYSRFLPHPIFFLFLVGWDWDSWYCGHYWPIVPAPDDRWLWRNLWNNWQGEQKYSDKICRSAALST
jgi:hypothetical protein